MSVLIGFVVQDLKKEHSVLSDEVKAINGGQISDTEIASAFELLSMWFC